MEKSKKISFTSIAIVVLAILLTVSLTMGGTLAWFANQNQAGTELTMGNAVGVAVVDATGSNGSMDKLSFTFHTGRNGELMLPGTQVDPDVRALIAKSNTNTILRAVVTFEVTVKQSLIADMRGAGYTVGDDGYMSVPSNITGSATGSAVERELYVLNQMYISFFNSLQASALYNGWVYRESNVGVVYKEGTATGELGNGNTKVFKGSTQPASTKYYIAGATQYSNQPLGISRTAGPTKTQATSGTYAAAGNVLYNAFYFRGWSGTVSGYTKPGDAYDSSTGSGVKYVDKGLDGTYAETYSKGSLVSSVYHGGGRAYYATRTAAYAGTGKSALSDTSEGITEEYQILEGTYTTAGGFVKTADPLGYRAGDATDGKPSGVDASADSLGALNVATSSVNDAGGANTIKDYEYTKDGWMNSGVQKASEDMMCVLNTSTSTVRVPLFTTSFVLPTTWTQDAFADRSMRLNLTFQVMQSDYLASGTSHHVSVELAESRFDDVTIWPDADGAVDSGIKKGQPYVKDVTNQPAFNNPAFWPDDYKNEMKPTPAP